LKSSLYAENIERYFKTYKREQILYIPYDQFLHSNESVLERIFGFLEVAPDFIPSVSKRINTSAVPAIPALHVSLLRAKKLRSIYVRIPETIRKSMKEKFNRIFMLSPLPLEEKIQAELIEYFRTDILRVQELLDWDLSHWLRISGR